MLPRLVATDLDGTLLRSDGTLGPRTRAALAALRSRGTEVVACTARPIRWTRGLAGEGGLSPVAVCANGAVIWDSAADVVLTSRPVDPGVAREVVGRLRTIVPGGTWALETVDSFAHETGYQPRFPVPDDTLVTDIDTLLERPAIKLLLRPDRDADAAALAPRVREAVADLVEVTWSDATATLLEMSASGVSKGSGLATLCAQRSIEAGDVIAFGDMPNDLPMLAWAGRSVAMGNGHPEALAIASQTTVTNDEEGVAVVLEALLEQA